MKLPQINYNTPVERLAQFDVNAPVREAAAKINIATTAGDLANDIQHAAAKHSANTGRSNTIRRMSTWSKENDGVAFYDSEDLIDRGVNPEILKGKDFIPSHEIKPSLYEAEYNKVMAEESQKIPAGMYREGYLKSAGDELFINSAAYTVKASKEQRQQQNAQISADIDDLVIDREYDLALSRISELRVDDSVKQEKTAAIKSDREFASYVDMVNFKQVSEARDALKKLRSEDSENMDELKQFKAINMLELMLKEDTTAKDIEKKNVAWRLNRMQKNAETGSDVDLKEYNDLIKLARDLGIEERYITEVNTAVGGNFKSKMISLSPANEQRALSENNRSKAKTTEEGIQASTLESITNRNISAMNKDMIGYYHSKTGNIPSIDFMGIAHIPGATGQALAERKMQHDVAKETLDVSQGYLKIEETDVIADLLTNASSDDIVEFTKEVNGALGRDAVIIYDQLRITRPELGSLTVVGQLSAIGQGSAASQVLRGHNYRKENPEVLQEIGLDFLPAIHEELKGVFSTNPRYQSSIKNAILDVYAIKAIDAGLNLESMDDTILEDSIRTVTGGLIEHGDNTIEPPYYGATQAVMDNWIRFLSPNYIDELGGAYHYSSKQIMAKIKDEDFLLESVGSGNYVIQTGKGQYLANKAGTSKFVLEFKDLAPVVPQDQGRIFNPKNDFGVKPIPQLTEDLARMKRKQQGIE